MKTKQTALQLLQFVLVILLGVTSCVSTTSYEGTALPTASPTITLQPPPVSTGTLVSPTPMIPIATATEAPVIIRTATPTTDAPFTFVFDSIYQILFVTDNPASDNAVFVSPFSNQMDYSNKIYGASNRQDLWFSSPTWSPDGQQIAFGMGGRIYTINVDGTDLKVLSFESTGGSSTVNWSPDNEVIAYYNQYRIYLIRPDGLEQHEIVLPGIGIYDMAWSPDAKRIAFIDRIGGDNYGTLYVIDRDGENFQQLTDKIVDDESGLDWSPDGEQIAFVTVNQTTGCQELSVYDMRSQSIAQIPNQTHIILKLDWSPDGDFIIFSGTEVSPCNSSEIKNEISMFIINMSDYSISPQLISSGAHDPAIWPTTRIHVGWSYRVTELGDNLNLREQAGTSATRLAQLDKGDIVLVLDGPQEVEAYQWWQVQTSDGLTGWVAEVPGWFVLESAEVEH